MNLIPISTNFYTSCTDNYIAQYKYKHICQDLLDLSEQEEKWVKNRFRVQDGVDHKMAFIIEKLLKHFKEEPAVYIKKGGELHSTLYILPQERCVYLKSSKTAHAYKCEGASKKGSAWLIAKEGRQVKSIMKFVPKEGCYVCPEEIQVSRAYSGKKGFPKVFTAFDYFKKTKDNITSAASEITTVKKSALFVERFCGDVLQFIENQALLKSLSNQYVVFYDTALALRALHADGRIHGDIKESNYLYMTDKGNDTSVAKAAVCDFGFSRKIDKPLPSLSLARKYPDLIHQASTAYYSPQSWQHLHDDDLEWTKKSDYNLLASEVYAYGMTMYRVVTGNTVPWLKEEFIKNLPVDNKKEAVKKIVEQQSRIVEGLQELKNTAETYHEKLLCLVLEMMDPEISGRPTMEQVVERLENLGSPKERI